MHHVQSVDIPARSSNLLKFIILSKVIQHTCKQKVLSTQSRCEWKHLSLCSTVGCYQQGHSECQSSIHAYQAITLELSCYYQCCSYRIMLGDLIIPVDSLTISLGIGFSPLKLELNCSGGCGEPQFNSQQLPWVSSFHLAY